MTLPQCASKSDRVCLCRQERLACFPHCELMTPALVFVLLIQPDYISNDCNNSRGEILDMDEQSEHFNMYACVSVCFSCGGGVGVREGATVEPRLIISS